MDGEDPPTEHYTFQGPVGLGAVLDRLGIEYLDVNEKRLIAIYRTAIINLTVTTGRIEDAKTIKTELWEPPRRESTAEDDPEAVLEHFITDVVTTTEPDEQ